MLVAGIGMLIWENINGSINTPLNRTLYAGLPILLVFLGLVSFEQFIQQFRSRLLNLLETMGDASYSLYLVHGFILSPCAMIAHKLHLTRYPLLFCLFLLLSAVLSGWLCYRYVELPLNKRIKITLAARKANAVSPWALTPVSAYAGRGDHMVELGIGADSAEFPPSLRCHDNTFFATGIRQQIIEPLTG
ncbi:acyltransferase [Candidatus Sodalis endolongispinus]|uniref:Acyltransferase n=1 Tax=Candidatus Sodalis endolongispinus TaxID=2812662 RepID=A0ABS5Y8A1_9GAMM|nr:hypothetical protein [Candidatus Sodalis endolongispinus]MBT9431229.1 acyltransferase [Candidatus Sodalis endolongispinus]